MPDATAHQPLNRSLHPLKGGETGYALGYALMDDIPFRNYLSFIQARPLDSEDWPVLACALILDCPIWTEDRDFFGTKRRPHLAEYNCLCVLQRDNGALVNLVRGDR
jgi:hypothetical protein